MGYRFKGLLLLYTPCPLIELLVYPSQPSALVV
jgi:hypothetical protein